MTPASPGSVRRTVGLPEDAGDDAHVRRSEDTPDMPRARHEAGPGEAVQYQRTVGRFPAIGADGRNCSIRSGRRPEP